MKQLEMVIAISRCKECCHRHIKDTPVGDPIVNFCNHPKQLSKDELDNTDVIPFWCPLEDI